MKIVAETVITDKAHQAIVDALRAQGFVSFAPSAKTDWTGKSLVVEQQFTLKGATIVLTLDTNLPRTE